MYSWTLAPYCSVDPQSHGLRAPPVPLNADWDAGAPNSTTLPPNMVTPMKEDPGSSAISSLSAAGVVHPHNLMMWDHEQLLHDLPVDEFSKHHLAICYEPLSGPDLTTLPPGFANSSPAPVTSPAALAHTAETVPIDTTTRQTTHMTTQMTTTPPRTTRASCREAQDSSDDDSAASDTPDGKRKTRMYKRRTAEELNIDTSLPEDEIRRLKRMLSNRESARRSRHRKAMQVQVLEAQVTDLKHTCREVKASHKQLRKAHNALREYVVHVSQLVREAGLVLPPLPEGVDLAVE